MDNYQIIMRLSLAIIIGGAIGYERQYKNRPAGLRTHILVCVGAAVVSMMQLHIVQESLDLVLKNPELGSAVKADSGRMPAQVITGIGFLGAGTIMHERGSIKGLTTAATVWVVGCLGLAIGYGYYGLSVIAGIFVFVTLVSLKSLEEKILSRGNVIQIDIAYLDQAQVTDYMRAYFRNHNIKIRKIEYTLEEDLDDEDITQEEGVVHGQYTLLVPRHIRSSDVLYNMLKHDSIFKARII